VNLSRFAPRHGAFYYRPPTQADLPDPEWIVWMEGLP
jgi:hypothetical protein